MELTFEPSILNLVPELITTRRDLHRHPELGYEERRTAGIIAERLEVLGYEVRTGLGETGVLGTLRGDGDESAPTIAFRADMDALPLQELNDHDYASVTPGCMHACGHDGHVAILLGFARWLAERETPFPGHVKLLFQPAEEGGGGAVPMIEAGVLEDPKVDMIFGLHLWNQLEVGLVGIKEGPLMAATDEFNILVKGRGGHGAIPQLSVDPIVAAAQVVLALQTIASRRVDPLKPIVVTVGSIKGGTTHNIIPTQVRLQGTARCFDPEIRRMLPQWIEECAASAAATVGAEIELEWMPAYPPLYNHARGVEILENAAAEVVGRESVVPAEMTMGGEDMAYYLQKVPGCFFWLGACNPRKGYDQAHHNPRFDFDEDALPIGVAVFAAAVELFFAAK